MAGGGGEGGNRCPGTIPHCLIAAARLRVRRARTDLSASSVTFPSPQFDAMRTEGALR